MHPVSPQPPQRSTTPWIFALIVVTVLGVVAVLTVAAVRPDRVIAGSAVPADNYGPQDTTTKTPKTTTTTTTAPKSVIPALTPGWQSAYSVSRSAAYDVPADWRVPTPTTIIGFEDGDNKVVMSGAATYADKACGDYSPRSQAGVTGSRLGDLPLAAREVAEKWAKASISEGGVLTGEITSSAPESLTLQGRPASHVTTTINLNAPYDCKRTATAVVHAVALSANNGQSVVMVIYADQGVADAPTAETMRQIYTTIRPANLSQAECKQDNEPVGTWC